MIWNYCNEVNQESWKKFGKPFSKFELNKMTSGCSKELGLHSQTVQVICEEYSIRCKQFKKHIIIFRTGHCTPLREFPIFRIGEDVNRQGY